MQSVCDPWKLAFIVIDILLRVIPVAIYFVAFIIWKYTKVYVYDVTIEIATSY